MSIKELERELDASSASATHHPFFVNFARVKTPEQLRRFGAQWYVAARGHKVAFPYLIAITRDDATRRELIEILRDEYGNGDPNNIHAQLLGKFMSGALGFTHADLEQIEMIHEVAEFGATTLNVWQGDPVIAYGYHYALERIAAGIHPAFFAGLRGYGFSPVALEYFSYHSRVEEEHAHAAEPGFTRYAVDGGSSQKLQEGAALGIRALARMWDGFNRHVFN